MSHKNYVAIEPREIEAMCKRYRTGASVADLMREFGWGRNKIVRTLKEALGEQYAECASLARRAVGQKVAPKLRGRKNPHTPEWDAKIAAAHVGRRHTAETRALLSRRNKERELDPEWQARKPDVVRKIVEGKRTRGSFMSQGKSYAEWLETHDHPMLGKKLSVETRAMLSARKRELVAQGWRPTQVEWTDERRERAAERTRQMWREGAFAYGDDGIKRSKLEKRVYAAILEIYPDARHTFPIHAPERSYYYDVCVPSLKLIVEVNGDFWHCNPTTLTDQEWRQVRDLAEVRSRDAEKHRVATDAGFRVVVLWEADLKRQDLTSVARALTGTPSPASS